MKIKSKVQGFDKMFSNPEENWAIGSLTYSQHILRDEDLVIGEFLEDSKKYVFYICKVKDELTTAQKALKKYLKDKFSIRGGKTLMSKCEILTDWTISKNVDIDLISGTHKSLQNTKEWWLKDKTQLF